jgi:hypothetical protein
MRRSLLCLLAAFFLAGPAFALSWSTAVSPKAKKKNKGNVAVATIGSGSNIAVLFAGYDVEDSLAQKWAEGVSSTLSSVDVGVIFAVPGPADSGFAGREIQVDVLAKTVASKASSLGSKLVIFAGHSSGAAVAEATLLEWAKAAPTLQSSTVYYRLDGGGGLSGKGLKKLGGAFCVLAQCSKTIFSKNLGACYGGYKKLTLATPNSCKVSKCCHLALINTEPKVLSDWDKKDYGGATSTPSTGWIDQTMPLLKSTAGIP